MLLPIPIAAVMALFFGPMMLAFAVMSPLLMAGTTLSDRLGNKRTYAAELAAYERHLGAAHERVSAACAEEARALRRLAPRPCRDAGRRHPAYCPGLGATARRRDALTRQHRAMHHAAAVRVIRPQETTGRNTLRWNGFRAPCPWPPSGSLGFCGDRQAVMGVLRVVLGQLAALHSPLDLDLFLIAGSTTTRRQLGLAEPTPPRPSSPMDHLGAGSPAWDDAPAARALCHRAGATGARTPHPAPAHGAPWTGPRTVVVLDGASALRGHP